jgi:hypothetical protein
VTTFGGPKTDRQRATGTNCQIQCDCTAIQYAGTCSNCLTDTAIQYAVTCSNCLTDTAIQYAITCSNCLTGTAIQYAVTCSNCLTDTAIQYAVTCSNCLTDTAIQYAVTRSNCPSSYLHMDHLSVQPTDNSRTQLTNGTVYTNRKHVLTRSDSYVTLKGATATQFETHSAATFSCFPANYVKCYGSGGGGRGGVVRLIVRLRRRHVCTWQKPRKDALPTGCRLSVVKQKDKVPPSNESSTAGHFFHMLRPNLFWVNSAKLLTQQQCAVATQQQCAVATHVCGGASFVFI